jgi:hypothetical protein
MLPVTRFAVCACATATVRLPLAGARFGSRFSNQGCGVMLAAGTPARSCAATLS